MKSILIGSLISAISLSQLDINEIKSQISKPYCDHYKQLEAFDNGEFNPPEAYNEIHKFCK